MKKTLAVASAASILFLTACGGAERPSVEDIASGLQSLSEEMGAIPAGAEVGDEFYTCWAENIHADEDISDDTAAAVASGDVDAEAPQEELSAVTGAASDCVDLVTP